MEAVRERGVGFACSYNSSLPLTPHLTSSQAMPMSYRVFSLPLIPMSIFKQILTHSNLNFSKIRKVILNHSFCQLSLEPKNMN